MKIYFNNLVDSKTGKLLVLEYSKCELSVPKFNDACFRTRKEISEHAKQLAKLHSVTI